jgi:hypothetical protein
MDAHQIVEAERRHQVYMMLRHLDARRNQIEADLLHVLTGEELPRGKSLSQLREHLDKVQALRRSYEAELVVTARAENSVAATRYSSVRPAPI